MFSSLRPATSKMINVIVNGIQISAPKGQTVWATMALANQIITRKSVLLTQDRSAYCAMGVCFECLIEIDGIPNQQACLRKVCDGMIISTQDITEQSVAQFDGI